jgi:hypothetical protein
MDLLQASLNHLPVYPQPVRAKASKTTGIPVHSSKQLSQATIAQDYDHSQEYSKPVQTPLSCRNSGVIGPDLSQAPNLSPSPDVCHLLTLPASGTMHAVCTELNNGLPRLIFT